MNEQIDTKADADLRSRGEAVGEFLSQNWLRLCALVATGALTGMAGWNLTSNWFFTVMLVLLAEGASLFWTARASDNGNPTQEKLSYAGAVVAWTAIIVTDLASATIIASLAKQEVFTLFKNVPGWSQKVVVYVLPTLAVLHGVLGTAHHYFSEGAKLERDLAKTRRDAKRQVAEAKAQAEIDIAKAQANRYKELAQQSAEGIGVTRGTQLWNTHYGNDISNVKSNDIPAEVTTKDMEVGQSVPFRSNGLKKQSH